MTAKHQGLSQQAKEDRFKELHQALQLKTEELGRFIEQSQGVGRQKAKPPTQPRKQGGGLDLFPEVK